MNMRKVIIPCLAAMALAMCGCGSGEKPAEFNVATYNIRLLIPGDSVAGNVWGVRHKAIADLVSYHDFDIFGTQEGFKVQLEDLKSQLPGYDYTGRGRNDGKTAGEHSAIFYRTDMFSLLDSGDFWMSETPDIPGRGWDAAEPRICSWGRFRHDDSGREFMFFNLHMDHKGVTARAESARLVLDKVKEIGAGLPVFVTGDFNVDQNSEPYATLTCDSVLLDSYREAAEVYALNGTFNGFNSDSFTGSRIDHVFVTPGIEVRKYGVLTDTYRAVNEAPADMEVRDAPAEIAVKKYVARMPSDHFPVKVSVSL